MNVGLAAVTWIQIVRHVFILFAYFSIGGWIKVQIPFLMMGLFKNIEF